VSRFTNAPPAREARACGARVRAVLTARASPVGCALVGAARDRGVGRALGGR
jgi:hypothetical protein